jgi:hypothetical protein
MANKNALGWIERSWMDDWDALRQAPKPIVAAVRGMMGNGVIELRRAVDQARYTQAIWDEPGDQVIGRMKQRYLEDVLEPIKMDATP